ncbi:MAG: SulP family inorganic anion transporter [Thiobacillus sp.]|nr:SulP family inorganic anion transporter [Thiobacillus sp.]
MPERTLLSRLRRLSPKTLKADLSAGLTTALVAIPDGIASAILAGLNPIHGLYALMIGTPIAAILASSHFMYVANTGALAVATGSALGEFSGETKVQALVVLVVLVGLIQLALGLLRLGGLVRFVANAVLIGFMTGIAVRIILSQLGELNGYHAEGGNAVLRTLDWIAHLHRSDPGSSAIGLGTLALVVLLNRTRAAQLAMAIALVVATLAVGLAGLDSVATLNDTALIPSGFPALALPQWSLVVAVFPAAAALAIIGLVQGAGVSKTIPNPDGSYPDISRDFSAKGAANIASGLFQGMPIGGAMSETAVSMKAGARSRWAGIFSGGFIILAVLLLADGVGYLAMPAIAALLVMAGIEAIKPARINDVWHSGWEPRVIMLSTFIATLVLPVQEAVFMGVALSMLHYLYASSVDVRIVSMTPLDNGSFAEHPAPTRLQPGQTVVLAAYGSLHFAAAATLEKKLPAAAPGACVILRLRGVQRAGSTLVTVIEQYARTLRRGGATLMLAEVSPSLYAQLVKTGTIEMCGFDHVFVEEDDVFAATRRALQATQSLPPI